MSYIAFQSPSREVRVSGRERANLRVACGGWLAMQLARASGWSVVDFTTALTGWRPRQQLGSAIEAREHLNLQCRAGDYFYFDGDRIPIFELQLNSVLMDGNDAWKLAAKIHGQCEIHGYIEGADRADIAAIINEGLEAGIYRRGMGHSSTQAPEHGWEAVIELLREDATEPVVTSYSVTDSFPGPHLAADDWEHDRDDPWEAGSQLSSAEQWQMSIAKLRAERGLRWSRETLDRYYGDGLTGVGLARRVNEKLEAARSAAA